MERNSIVFLGSLSVAALAISVSACSRKGGAVRIGDDVHQVSVVASGLVGSGLLLQDDGMGSLAVSPNAAAQFAVLVANGATYRVIVRAQPVAPRQTCSVRDGSGTVDKTGPPPVRVTCETNTYPIGVTVSGLTGAGLILQDDGGDDLSVSEKGTVFATPRADQSAYVVTILTQPLGQICAVTNGSGTVDGVAPSAIMVNCG